MGALDLKRKMPVSLACIISDSTIASGLLFYLKTTNKDLADFIQQDVWGGVIAVISWSLYKPIKTLELDYPIG